MTNLSKETITQEVDRQIKIAGSQNQLARQLGISASHLINIRNGNFDLVSETMVRKVVSQLKMNLFQGWQMADIRNYTRILNICHHAKENSISRAIAFAPGTGKTYTLKSFSVNLSNVYYVECEEYWTKKVFLSELRKVMGIDDGPMSIADQVDAIVEFLNQQKRPLVLIDEADKLKDSVLNLYKTMYNKASSGFVLAGTPYFKHRIDKGVRLNRMGFAEIFSRIGGEFVSLYPINSEDITKICQVNGVQDTIDIQEIINESKADLRRVKALVEKVHLRNSKRDENNKS